MTSETGATRLGTDPTTFVTGATRLGTAATTFVTGVTTLGTGVAALGTGVTALGTGATALGTGATALGTGATPLGTGATPLGPDATPLGTDASRLGTAPTRLGIAARRPESVFPSVVSVPPGPFVGLFAPVEGCWPGCRPKPSVLATPWIVFRGLSVTLPTGLLAAGLPWPEALVPPLPDAAEPLETGSATATAPPVPPISRAAASPLTAAAKRKCDGTTIP